MSRQENSDPLPFVQVDRAIDPTAALLAGHMKVTNQHAIGSLVSFWRLCGDPRELERIVEKTPEGEEPAVILSAEDVAMRFELAAGVRVEPVVLARLGVLEPKAGDFRVRGMSRFFEPIEKRRRTKRTVSIAGKASAESRKKSTGSAQPRGGRGDAVRSVARSVSRSVTTEHATEHQPNIDGTSTEHATERSRTLESREQRAESIFEKPPVASQPVLELVPTEPEPPAAQSPHQATIDALCVIYEQEQGSKYPFKPRDAKAVKEMLGFADPFEVVKRWRRALGRTKYPTTRTIPELAANWTHFASDDTEAGYDPNQGILR